jgi:hypothetical protein
MSIINSTLLTADTILWSTKHSCSQLMKFFSSSIKKCNPPALAVPPLPHLTFCTPSKSVYISQIPWPLLKVALTYTGSSHSTYQYHVLFHRLVCAVGSFLVRDSCIRFATRPVFTRPTPKLEDHFLSAVHDCLLNLYFAATHRISCHSSIPLFAF